MRPAPWAQMPSLRRQLQTAHPCEVGMEHAASGTCSRRCRWFPLRRSAQSLRSYVRCLVVVLDSPLHATVSFFAFSLLKRENAKDPGRSGPANGSRGIR